MFQSQRLTNGIVWLIWINKRKMKESWWTWHGCLVCANSSICLQICWWKRDDIETNIENDVNSQEEKHPTKWRIWQFYILFHLFFISGMTYVIIYRLRLFILIVSYTLVQTNAHHVSIINKHDHIATIIE